ncbi:MAG: DUF971 domain-containing protein [Planctomycetota bacterium]
MSDPQDCVPTSITRTEDRGIEIRWSDGHLSRWTAQQLRDACPCATCREKRGETDSNESAVPNAPIGLPVLSQEEARPVEIEAMQPVGTYAYNIAFSDGHHSGLYTFEKLRR